MRCGSAGVVGEAAETVDRGRRRIAGFNCARDAGGEARQDAVEFDQAIGADQALGGRRTTVGRDEPIPTAHQPITRHQSLPNGERLAIVACRKPDLCQPPCEFGRRFGESGQGLETCSKLGIVRRRIAASPAARTVTAKPSIQIIAKRRRQGTLIPRIGPHRDRPAAALRQRIGQCPAFRRCRRQRCPRRGQLALRPIALLGGFGAAHIGLFEHFLRSSQCFQCFDRGFLGLSLRTPIITTIA